MISCGEAEEFIPHGKKHMEYHPGDTGLAPSKHIPPNHHITLLKELNTVNLNCYKDSWELRKSKDGLTEEELYFVGKTVVWSRGQMGIEDSKFVIKSMTCDSEVYQTVFAIFYTYPDLPSVVGDALPDEPTGDVLPCICILERDCLSVYAESGEDYSVALPFSVKRIWPMKFGLLIERQVTTTELSLTENPDNTLPIFYSLLHPQDEINPILSKTSKNGAIGKNISTKDNEHFLVSVHSEPSICILYTGFSNTVKICKIRRSKHEENLKLLQTSVMGSGIISAIGTPLNSDSAATSFYLTPSHTPTPTGLRGRPNIQQTPKMTYTHSRTISRNASPLCMNQQMRLGLTPSPSRCNQGPKIPKGMNQSLLNDINTEAEPLIPDICLELMWSGYCAARPASAFLTNDHNGQKYLCLLFPQISTLKCFKYEFINEENNVVVGSENVIQAKDAIFISGLNMMVIVDPSNTLLLYTGPVFICRLHLAGLSTLNSTLFKDFSYLNISSKLNSPLGTPMRRSSLLAASAPSSDIKFEDGLSPVKSEKTNENSFVDDSSLPISASIVSVRDSTDIRLTLEHSSGKFYRVSLPALWTSLIVRKSIDALKYVLPKDLSLKLVNKWYTVRNTPGNGNFSPQAEWKLFSKTVLSMIGYDVEKLSPSNQFDGSTSPMMVSKKFRATECGSDNDWDYLLSSSYHRTLGNYWSEVLHFENVEILEDINQLSRGRIDSSAPLFNQLPAIFFALHLVYEEFKANSVNWEFTSLMVPCLMQLSSDLDAKLYFDHYWRDFPNLCSLQGPPTQLSREDSGSLLIPGYFSNEPPSLYSHLYSIMKGAECEPFPYIPSVCESSVNLIILYEVAATNCYINDISCFKFLQRIVPSCQAVYDTPPLIENVDMEEERVAFNVYEKIVILTTQLGLNQHSIKNMSPALSLLLMNAQHLCRTYPHQDWPASAYELIERPDLAAQKKRAEEINLQKESDKFKENEDIRRNGLNENVLSKTLDKPKEEDDGMECLDFDLLSLRWPEDQRVMEVRKMLCSSRPVIINIQQRPGVSDHDFLEEQERQLYASCIRTMALPMGRGMFTLCTHSPIITEALPIPPLNLKGRAPPRGPTIDFPVNEVPPDMDMWPL